MSSPPQGTQSPSQPPPPPPPIASSPPEPVPSTAATTTPTPTTSKTEPGTMSSPGQSPAAPSDPPPATTTTSPPPPPAQTTTTPPVVATTTDPSTTTTTTTNNKPTDPPVTTAAIPPPRDTTATTTTTTTTTTPYTTHYITTVSVLTITTVVPRITVISGSVTTIYGIQTTTILVPTLIPDPAQPPPPPPASFDIVSVSDRGLQSWQITLIIIAGFVLICACASVFLVGRSRKKKKDRSEKGNGGDGDALMPATNVESWTDPSMVATAMGSPQHVAASTAGAGDSARWNGYEKEAAVVGIDSRSATAAIAASGGLVLTGYSGLQSPQQHPQHHQQQGYVGDAVYLGHGQDYGGNDGLGGGDFYCDLQEAIVAAGSGGTNGTGEGEGPYRQSLPPQQSLLSPSVPQHPHQPLHAYNVNPQESPIDPFHPSIFRDEGDMTTTTNLEPLSSSQIQHQHQRQNQHQEEQQLQPQSESQSEQILYSSPLMHLQMVGSPCNQASSNSSTSPLLSAPLTAVKTEYADGFGYGYYPYGMFPRESQDQPLIGVVGRGDSYKVPVTESNHGPQKQQMERNSKEEVRRKSPQALPMVKYFGVVQEDDDDDDVYSAVEVPPSSLTLSSSQVEGHGLGIVERTGQDRGGDKAEKDGEENGDYRTDSQGDTIAAHGRGASSTSLATSGEGSASGNSSVKTLRYLDRLRV